MLDGLKKIANDSESIAKLATLQTHVVVHVRNPLASQMCTSIDTLSKIKAPHILYFDFMVTVRQARFGPCASLCPDIF